jgi:uncharacterized YigZ family protein
MSDDLYYTIKEESSGLYTEKKSKFFSFAIPVASVEQIKERLEVFKKTYYDARHICYAYVLGADRLTFRANDNGEPSGTAGKPILGQINSRGLTDVLVVVIRYFGGIKLGTSGLITAYRAAAVEALDAAEVQEKTVTDTLCVSFEYPFMNEVMRVIKELEPHIVSQAYDTNCIMELSIRRGRLPQLAERLLKVDTLSIIH